jgi:hypothetical protein
MTYNKGPMDSSRKTIHTHLDLTKSPDYSSGRGAPTTPERVKKLVREHPKHKEMLAKGFTLSTYGEHKPPTFGKVVKEGVNLDSFSETDLEEMKRSNPFLYVGKARHARKARRTKNEDVEFTAEELERLEAIMHEAKDEREYGYEGEMASSQLRSIIQNAEALLGMLQPDTDLPEWVQSKITLAQDYMLSAKDYMSTEMSEETKLNELKKTTLGSYIKKATTDVDVRSYSLGADHGTYDSKDKFAKKADDDAEKKISSRKAFIGKAVDRLTK